MSVLLSVTHSLLVADPLSWHASGETASEGSEEARVRKARNKLQGARVREGRVCLMGE